MFLCVYVCFVCVFFMYFHVALPKSMLECYKRVFISIKMKLPYYTKLLTSINLPEESSSFPTSLSSPPLSFLRELSQRID